MDDTEKTKTGLPVGPRGNEPKSTDAGSHYPLFARPPETPVQRLQQTQSAASNQASTATPIITGSSNPVASFQRSIAVTQQGQGNSQHPPQQALPLRFSNQQAPTYPPSILNSLSRALPPPVPYPSHYFRNEHETKSTASQHGLDWKRLFSYVTNKLNEDTREMLSQPVPDVFDYYGEEHETKSRAAKEVRDSMKRSSDLQDKFMNSLDPGGVLHVSKKDFVNFVSAIGVLSQVGPVPSISDLRAKGVQNPMPSMSSEVNQLQHRQESQPVAHSPAQRPLAFADLLNLATARAPNQDPTVVARPNQGLLPSALPKRKLNTAIPSNQPLAQNAANANPSQQVNQGLLPSALPKQDLNTAMPSNQTLNGVASPKQGLLPSALPKQNLNASMPQNCNLSGANTNSIWTNQGLFGLLPSALPKQKSILESAPNQDQKPMARSNQGLLPSALPKQNLNPAMLPNQSLSIANTNPFQKANQGLLPSALPKQNANPAPMTPMHNLNAANANPFGQANRSLLTSALPKQNVNPAPVTPMNNLPAANGDSFQQPPQQPAQHPIQEQPVQEQPVQEQPVQDQPVQDQPVEEQPGLGLGIKKWTAGEVETFGLGHEYGFMSGFEWGQMNIQRTSYAAGFEYGRRSASPVAYKLHLAALTELAWQARVIQTNHREMLRQGTLEKSLDDFAQSAQKLVELTVEAAKKEELTSEEYREVAEKGKYSDFLSLAVAEPAVPERSPGEDGQPGPAGAMPQLQRAVQDHVPEPRLEDDLQPAVSQPCLGDGLPGLAVAQAQRVNPVTPLLDGGWPGLTVAQPATPEPRFDNGLAGIGQPAVPEHHIGDGLAGLAMAPPQPSASQEPRHGDVLAGSGQSASQEPRLGDGLAGICQPAVPDLSPGDVFALRQLLMSRLADPLPRLGDGLVGFNQPAVPDLLPDDGFALGQLVTGQPAVPEPHLGDGLAGIIGLVGANNGVGGNSSGDAALAGGGVAGGVDMMVGIEGAVGGGSSDDDDSVTLDGDKIGGGDGLADGGGAALGDVGDAAANIEDVGEAHSGETREMVKDGGDEMDIDDGLREMDESLDLMDHGELFYPKEKL
ncbi:hypothetical protein N656DRAFT_798342 [Canariomyces notabilis]|uniref:Uncharacterized protein n=1 Tax=Canariomyces notabilis TaxID=2074819 RepID=A0AAN6YS41_9PEZI|nr:hypothetical protein N656DRAFT_798342 [Canariomyces arenarius]